MHMITFIYSALFVLINLLFAPTLLASKNDKYISTCDDLQTINDTNFIYKLTQNIDCKNQPVPAISNVRGFSNQFIIDGQGHTIENFVLADNEGGFFEKITNQSFITLKLKDITIKQAENTNLRDSVVGPVGLFASDVRILDLENVKLDGVKVEYNKTEKTVFVGGLIGKAEKLIINNATVRNLTVVTSSRAAAGGLVGYLDNGLLPYRDDPNPGDTLTINKLKLGGKINITAQQANEAGALIGQMEYRPYGEDRYCKAALLDDSQVNAADDRVVCTITIKDVSTESNTQLSINASKESESSAVGGLIGKIWYSHPRDHTTTKPVLSIAIDNTNLIFSEIVLRGHHAGGFIGSLYILSGAREIPRVFSVSLNNSHFEGYIKHQTKTDNKRGTTGGFIGAVDLANKTDIVASNSKLTINVQAEDDYNAYNIGGFIGGLDTDELTINMSSADSTLKNGQKNIGGLIGYLGSVTLQAAELKKGTYSINNSFANVKIEAEKEMIDSGGLIGSIGGVKEEERSLEINNSYVQGSIKQGGDSCKNSGGYIGSASGLITIKSIKLRQTYMAAEVASADPRICSTDTKVMGGWLGFAAANTMIDEDTNSFFMYHNTYAGTYFAVGNKQRDSFGHNRKRKEALMQRNTYIGWPDFDEYWTMREGEYPTLKAFSQVRQNKQSVPGTRCYLNC